MNELLLEKLFNSVKQYWPYSLLMDRPLPYWPDEIRVYWFTTRAQSSYLIRILYEPDDSSFVMASYHCPDPDVLQQFRQEYLRSGVDFLMLPYAVQGMKVIINGDGTFLTNSVKTNTAGMLRPGR
ncbi:hypothetical protein DYBT9275_02399 [Dyadobacter sp. CECT 9275]|uniref:Uncharacterized protein n=1 Tax=Dyadobacter helix TaxID=2822344 RepID=A0A916JFK5_9BACT|nr:hypothetical protein [Dyadobacter sp. CECT 9275]CAG5000135.1 hypothetical protein DYBT9275_02399 [Dyadobacter sp. CECT 9275]